ncbi:MAG: hypothetical protein HOB40_07255 [Candidatus Marinimicrobia bacterium]|jgi:hypothetical protein|nr:hypothetical protein [Candidatus Neomarinimicrobiota bacterium]MBT3501195.1 hypothetical protein [Candidatus Neomarinimicrobiota bacterium]MBT3839477.1 hypothetical protein [Candidatus Neomarinimicrobiota bacterium]MBT3999377.1 hypothetical protein [Candidatus Neomarinimicrobiota bacterium]MBT4282000.1 hypothetical protein [Candidatus Neomarinimicrobiota bacterium]
MSIVNKIIGDISIDTDSVLMSDTEQDRAFLNRIAKKIQKSGFVTPAIFFLETTKPLALLGSHALIFFGPILNAFIQSENYYRTVQVFEEPENIEILLQMIETFETEEKNNNGDNHE